MDSSAASWQDDAHYCECYGEPDGTPLCDKCFTPCGTGAAQTPRTTTKHLQNQGFGVSTLIGVRSRAKRLIGAFQAVRRSREPRIGVRSVALARSVGHGCDKSNPHKVGDCG